MCVCVYLCACKRERERDRLCVCHLRATLSMHRVCARANTCVEAYRACVHPVCVCVDADCGVCVRACVQAGMQEVPGKAQCLPSLNSINKPCVHRPSLKSHKSVLAACQHITALLAGARGPAPPAHGRYQMTHHVWLALDASVGAAAPLAV